MRRRPATTAVSLTALVLAGLAVPITGTAARAAEPARTATLVGSLQDELGCPGDWQPTCTATDLIREGDTTTYSQVFTLPKGSYELKVAINHSWDESYGQGSGNVPLVLGGTAKLKFTYDDATHAIGITPLELAGPATPADAKLATAALRELATRERFYFVMADRFANGDSGNDQGGLTGSRLETGYDPTDAGFYHGGDLKGVTQKLDYIKGLGTTAIWLTPSFKNRPVQGSGSDASAGYHGYWVTDFTQIDPHLGTNAEMKALIAAAHAKGMKVYFDIITNHTADVVDYEGGKHGYISKETAPYKAADGTVFDDATVAGKPMCAGTQAAYPDCFPPLSAATSFPYKPVFRTDADKTVKVPAWLNDPTMYHNRGDSTFAGESSSYGDFVGLDDLFTERSDVVTGMEDIYKSWVDFGIDGFRIDTVKHVNMQFWQSFSPAILKHAKEIGKPGFNMFGEVFDSNPAYMSQFTTTGKLPATLDFGFQSAALGFAQGKATTGVRDLFAGDDYYTDTDSNAYELPTFLGNHDMGRIGAMLLGGSYDNADAAQRKNLLDRTELANSLMFLTRGNPVVYYGDEQGFTGPASGFDDKRARQDMFGSKTSIYQDDVVIGSPDLQGDGAHYSTSVPLYQHIKQLAALRQAHPALADGAQIHRYASDAAGIYAFSRIDKSAKREYVVATNNATSAKSATFETFSAGAKFVPLLGGSGDLRADKAGRVTVTLPPLSVAVYRANATMTASPAAPAIYPTSPSAGGVVGGRAEIGAAVPANTFAEVSFLYRPVGTSTWTPIGTDDNAPYRVFHDVSGMAKGTLLEYRMVAKDISGRVSATSTYGIVGEPQTSGGGGGGGVGPVTQPQNVSVPGNHNSEMGCPGDWQPDCSQAQLTLDAKDEIWKGTYTIPAGDYEYKAAINKKWDENYGAGAVSNGGNIAYKAPGGSVTFYYDHRTHWVTSTAQGPIITAPGSFQSELGCPGDWAPDCMRSWLQDPDGDGTYTFSTDQIPAGNYEFKVAVGLSWNESYPANNVAFSVPADGVVTTITYKTSDHTVTVKTSKAGAAPDLTKAKAFIVGPDLVAWPASALPAGVDPATLKWRLHWSADGGLAVDAEAVTGGSVASLTRDPAGLPASLVAAHPELKGAVALRLDQRTAKQLPEILKGQVAVAMYDSTGKLLDATGAQTAIALDSLYAAKAATRSYGVSFTGGKVGFSLWAPTAQSATLLTWPAGSPDQPASAARRVAMTRADDGSWSASLPSSARNVRYLFEVKVYAPSTGKVETNLVTDPNSVALTLNSTRSVAVDLKDTAYMPSAWRTAKAPALAKDVDSTIYELHIRDYSMSDAKVPAAKRGSYLAFAENGDGRTHLKELAKAGLNTVHLLPSFDIASIEEDPAKQQTPQCDLASYAPDSTEQQKCVGAVASKDAFNWGYDPYHYSVPDGSYASSAAAADGGSRVAEFRTMVGALHEDGLRVVLDEVFNHTAASGQADKSVLDKVVPGYYQRLNAMGAVETSTCCQNVATEHAMAQKLMVDSVVMWARDYKVDGFRFDLMGHHSKANMLAVRSALDALTPQKDGVDGKAIYLYGEGWNFGEVANNALFVQATQGQLGGTGIGTFSDRLRDAVRGGGPFDEDPRKQGFGSGEATDDNGAVDKDGKPVNVDAAGRLAHDTDLVQLGLAGNLRTFTFRSQASGSVVKGTQVDYNGSPAGYADEPDEVISYVDAHDNETLFDSLTYKLPVATTMKDRVRMNTLSLATTALAQTPSFWHAGADLLRSKSLNRDSYDSGDWFNRLDWTGVDNGFGHGLPPEAQNSAKWSFMKPLLANPALKPAASDVKQASAMAEDLLKLRFSSPLFRLGSAAAINAKVSFPVSGTADAHQGVIVMRIDDTVGADVDPALRGAVVVFNATPSSVSQKVAGLTGQVRLSPVQANGADSVVKQAAYDAGTGALTVPARTVAVFVQPN
ncbi:pullulanase-type alpha-1,6-glucosidase [Humibacillus xanthopallidus]|uniref:Pullulanase-type alpha-1,6-glucosidase n=1 Tax=Humibacillus xanthopallidus TaxID=412689 RepID=A0A543PRK6_9MICO|nr:pullulanase-type alpha-1,6-glucosidase [Humibacillus xanthopallidus]TQN46695.1 pullulanase-type alpha-1,6-glucosidase [Humibacillus xanthopallidus]